MIHKFLQLLNRCKSYASSTYSLYDLTEFLHLPWHTNELWLLVAFVAWFVIVKMAVVAFLQFGKRMPYVFNRRSCGFLLWLLYAVIAVIAVSNVMCSFYHGVTVIKLVGKSVITAAALALDFHETLVALRRFRKSEI